MVMRIFAEMAPPEEEECKELITSLSSMCECVSECKKKVLQVVENPLQQTRADLEAIQHLEYRQNRNS